MDTPRIAALKRFARGLGYAVVAGGLTFAIDQLPTLSTVVPAPEIAIPVLTALLLAVDKFVRAKRVESASAPTEPPAPPA